ncbi:hypothetical protein LENED_008754 [Lentinula edodes]|uniref:F-box domain-containing protein n=1 Tax=Lentinula edodes TaxID=5353 RepID=A0A1Q3EHZ5_LENED|nr:hypothetical protein LENED_008754 [Lentinula edodes]
MTRRSLRIAKKLSVTTRESTAQAGASRIPSENADHPLSQVARPAHSNRKRPKFNNDGPENSDDDDNYRNESNYTQFKRNKRRRTKMPDEFRGVRGKLGLLEKLARDVPLDIMFEIFCYLEPNDLINLARTTRDLRGILMSKSSELIWRTARSNLDGLPPLPKDLSEPQYADLLFCTHCYFCSKKGACEPPFWSFRTRCCRACAVQTFPQLYNLKRTQPRDYRDANILPREVISPVTRIGRKSTTVRHIGHLALAQRLRAEYDALSKEEDIDIWIALKMEEQEAVREHGRLCQEWYVTMLENRQEELLEERKQMIFKKLKEIGLREEVEIMINSPQSHLFLRHDSVNQSKQLTEQVEVCNLDPRTTTTQDLYAANPLAECSTCDQSNHWRNSGRLFMRFKELLVHKFTDHYPIKPHEYTVNSFGVCIVMFKWEIKPGIFASTWKKAME